MYKLIQSLKILQYHLCISQKTYSVRPILSSELPVSSLWLDIQKRLYAKGKDKKKDVKVKKIVVSEEEIGGLIDVDKMKTEMDKAVEHLKTEYLRTLSLRSTTGAIDTLKLKLDGKKVDIMEVARIIRNTPGTVILDFSNHSHVIPIALKAIEKSGMNLNPRQDGTSVYIPIPRITKEYREGLAKNAKSLYIKCRDSIKDVQNKFIKTVKGKSKDGFSDDNIHRVTDQITEMGNIHVQMAEKIYESKTKELLE